MPGKLLKAFLFATCVLALAGCSLYQNRLLEARGDLRQRHFQEAADRLKQFALQASDDQLVYLLDYATALQYAGQYQESNRAFQLADRLSEVKDYHSISRIAGSLLTAESLIQYKGEDFEKILINTFGAINYLMLGDLENALVEARRVNDKLRLYRDEAKLGYEQSVFARYVSALAWEADGKYDDAYIDYAEAYKLNPGFEPLKKDLIRSATLAQRPDQSRKWENEFGHVDLGDGWKNPKYGELILIFQQGWGPIKRPHPAWPRIPKLFPVAAATKQAELVIDGGDVKTTQDLYSIQKVAIDTMEEAYAGLIAKRIAGKVVKYGVANEIHKRNKALGELAWIAMNVADQADLRQWSTLPATIQIARVFLPAGTYQVEVRGLSAQGYPSGEAMAPQSVTVQAKKKAFVNWRSFD